MLRIRLVRSTIGQNKRNRATVAALGLRKMHQSVYHQDNPTIRGMVHHVKHMLLVEEVSEADVPKKSQPAKAAAAKPAPVKEAKAAPVKEEKPADAKSKPAAKKAETEAKPKAATAKKSTKKSEEGK